MFYRVRIVCRVGAELTPFFVSWCEYRFRRLEVPGRPLTLYRNFWSYT
jgi:hypothetical protein